MLAGAAWSQPDLVEIQLRTDPPDAEVYTSDGSSRICADARQPFAYDRKKLSVADHMLPFLTVQLRRSGYLNRPERIDSQVLLSQPRVTWPGEGQVIALSPTWSTRLRLPLLAAGVTVPLLGLLFFALRRKPPVPAPVEPVEDILYRWELDPGTRVDRYRVVARIGEGATAVVYRVTAEARDEEFALKLLKPAELRDTDVMARFRREMKTLARLRCANIPFLEEYGEYRGMVYLVMELLSGESLRSRLLRGRLTWLEAADTIRQLAAALDFAHGQGVLHRDVKPDNVVLGTDGRVRLTDFGLARAADSTTLTAEGALMGTPAYMAPELVQGQRATENSDQYALGCLAFELVAGTQPFQGETPLSVAVQQVSYPPPEIANLAGDAPPWLLDVVRKMMSKDPDGRFPGMKAVLEAMDRQASS